MYNFADFITKPFSVKDYQVIMHLLVHVPSNSPALLDLRAQRTRLWRARGA
jgi:hypothetical protein